MVMNRSRTICALVTMLLIVGSMANARVTIVDRVNVGAIDLKPPCKWQHLVKCSGIPVTINYAKLEIEAFGILNGWDCPVYLEENYLGNLAGAEHNWARTNTTFCLDEYLTELMAGPVCIEVGGETGAWGVDLRTSKLTVTDEPEKPWPYSQPAPFTLVVLPRKMVVTVPGQKCVFLVKIIEEGFGDGKNEAVNISAIELDVQDDTVVTVDPEEILPGQVGEVTVIPGRGGEYYNGLRSVINGGVPIPDGQIRPIIDPNGPVEDKTLTICIVAERHGLIRAEGVNVNVTQGKDELAGLAGDYRDRFVPWLAENYSGLGIDEETEWSGTIIRPNIVGVMYYLFFSEEWEMGLRWHVTVPRYEYAEIYLRRRDTELSSTHAFRMYSLYGQAEPQVIDLYREGIWR